MTSWQHPTPRCPTGAPGRRDALALLGGALAGLTACARRPGGASSRGALAREAAAAPDRPPLAKPTAYIAAYDTESPRCLAACRKIVEIHKRLAMPATFFIVGKTLENDRAAYRALLDDPLFEIASHTYSHQMLRDHPMCGPQVPPDELRRQIVESKQVIERVFDRPCVGLRPACGFADGLRGARDALALIAEAGYRYTSSLLWGPDYSLPALLSEPFRYEADGHPELWELPGHGWHENLLKDNNKWGPRRLTLWPPPMPAAIPEDFLRTPEDEVRLNRVFLDAAATGPASYVSLVWHPWSLAAFDPELRMLEKTFADVRALGLSPTTYAEHYRRLSGAG